MGRSAVNKRNNVTGGGENETTLADHTSRYHCSDKPKQQTSVKALMEKLKYLKPLQNDILKLESVKTVTSALGKKEYVAENSEDASSCKTSNLLSTDSNAKFQRSSHLASSDPQASSKVVGRVGKGGGNKQSCNSDNNFDSGHFTSQMKNPRGKISKYNSTSDSTSSAPGVSNPIPSDLVGSSNSSVTTSSVVYAKQETLKCTIESPNLATELFRPPVSCAICNDVRSVDRVSGISPAEFERVSNCDAETSHILRHHYQRPYFVPETAESTHADSIFMGTPGHGAHMHVDHVINPSWQGQIKGFKRWHLQPPPECLYECHSFHVDVHPGDIIVLDTNKWYHQTEILDTENSITIGSEYD